MRVTGPIPLALFMKQCLTSPDSGYYTTRHGEDTTIDPFGKHGDFITSPEISQMFGEMVGIWVVAEWIKQGRARERVQLIELGPGRGTLMDDVLRVRPASLPLARLKLTHWGCVDYPQIQSPLNRNRIHLPH